MDTLKHYRARRFQGYTFDHFRKDLISGVIVGIIAIPLGMAFAIASGVKPEYGLYTSVVAGILISLAGGSRFQIGGPTGAFIPILLGIVLAYGYENLLLAGFLAGILLLLMGIFRLGALIKFIPRPVTIGFTAGIAVIIFASQIANFLGLTGVESHVRFLDNIKEIVKHIGSVNGFSVAAAAICLLVMTALPRIWPKIPSALAGLIVSATIVGLLFPGNVPTIGSTFGAIEQSLPALQFPEISLERIQMLLVPALLIALLGGVESLLSAVVADGMTNDRHNSNRELIGQGIANMITPLFGGIPATGAIARTATNIKSGASSPVSGVIHGLTVLFVLLVFAPLASDIPLASMAPILMMVAWNMSERKRFMYILKMKSGDTLVLVVTFLLTVWVDLMTGVGAGMLLAFVLFIRYVSKTAVTTNVLPGSIRVNAQPEGSESAEIPVCTQVGIINVEGVLFFGSAQSFEQELLDSVRDRPKVVLLRMNKVPFMDISCASYFSGVVHHIQKYGGTVLISEIRSQPKSIMIKSGLYETIGASRFYNSTTDAMEGALEYLDTDQCAVCGHLSAGQCAGIRHAAMSEWRKLPQ